MIYADTNYQVNDPALLGRLGQPIIASGPKTQDDLIALMRIELKDGFLPNKNYVKLKDKEWKEVGKLAEEYAAEANLSGRDVRNICETLSNHANQFKLPKGFQGWSYQKQLDHKAKHQVYKPITAGMLKKELNTYVESVKAAVDREQEEKKAKIIEDLHLTREAYASDEESRISLFRELAAQIPKDQMVSIIRKVI